MLEFECILERGNKNFKVFSSLSPFGDHSGFFFLMCMHVLTSGSSDQYQRAGRDGSSVLCRPAEAEEADGAPQPPTPAGFGG